jgi:PAS domain S-box-containing protein
MPRKESERGEIPDIRDLIPARLFREIQESFSELAGFPVLLVDASLLATLGDLSRPKFCAAIEGSLPGMCAACRAGAAAASPVVPGPRKCPAGPVFVIVPVEKGELRFGALWLGPVHTSPEGAREALRFAESRGVPPEVLEGVAWALPTTDLGRLEGTSRLMAGFARALGETLQGALATRWREELLERKYRAMEEKVLEGKEFLESILQGARACIIAVALGGRIATWPAYNVEYFGYTAAEAQGMEAGRLFADPARMPEILAAVDEKGHFEGELDLVRKDGSQSVNRLLVTPYRDRSGRPQGHVLVALDITSQKELETRLHVSEERSRGLLETLPDAFYQADLQGRMTYINESGARVLGFAPEDLIGKDLARDLYVDPADRTELLRRLREGGGVVQDFLTKLWRGDGQQIWISAHTRYRRNARGEVIGVEGVVRDVSDRVDAEHRNVEQMQELERAYDQLKQAQTRLVHSEKMAALGTLVASIAHEINNPVNFVHGNLSFIERTFQQIVERADVPIPRGRLLQDLREALADAKKGAERVKEIVESLRTFSKAGARPKHEEVRLSRSLEEALRLVEPSRRDRVRLTRRLDPGLSVLGDAGQLGQVWLNLLVNASQAIRDSGEIEVAALREGADAVVRVRDTGDGIPPEVQAHLFEPFFSGKAEGIGLGLSLSNDIVRGHGGEITFRTEEGKGTTFEVRLPAIPVPPAAPQTGGA